MKRPLYCIRDRKGEFWSPSLDQNDDSAIRNFGHMINTGDTIMNYSPGDFELCKIAMFDTETGVITPEPVIKVLVSGDSIEWRK